MFRIKSRSKGFHTKGYIFKKEEIYRMIIGSSNMTLSAITRSKEWNNKIVSTINEEYTREVLEQFHDLWNDKQSQYYDEFISYYTEKYMKNKLIREQKQQALKEQIVELDQYTLQPNKMQAVFVEHVMEMWHRGIKRALLLSATGTGKTYASAFALREMNPRRVRSEEHTSELQSRFDLVCRL